MPTNTWYETLDIKQHIELDHNIDISTEEGIAEFEEIKSKVTEVLKGSLYYITDEELAELSKDSEDYRPVRQLRTIIEWLEGAGSPEKYTQELGYLYNWADEFRIWLGP